MLKALELVGFKSFADKTRFDFPAGITVIVGPNGSGKSNIVDAIKWVLGEQSAKSLRGQEMADVIFKGSVSDGRKPMNTAEATIVFDNSDERLPINTPEVHVTRRVYRSGEGEYMVNGQPCRLRDIKDLFSGSGLGSEAYSLIEQGKVDVLLQASSRDRRAIFEEAAGISRFKAKKIESQRRLERVEQNLLRLSDIVEEVESRLRSVRAQANKAQRCKENSDRLQELRIQVGLADWRALSEKLVALETDLSSLHIQAEESKAKAEAVETHAIKLDSEIAEINKEIRVSEARSARNSERIAGTQSTTEHQRQRCKDLEQEITRHREQLAAMTLRADDLKSQLIETTDAAQAAESDHENISCELKQLEETLTEITKALDHQRSQNDSLRKKHLQQMQQVSSLDHQLSVLQSKLDSATSAIETTRRKIKDNELEGSRIAEELKRLQAQEQLLAETNKSQAIQIDQKQNNVSNLRSLLDERKQLLSDLQGRRSGANERATVLEELELRLEGLNSGVKEVLTRSREDHSGPFSKIRGVVADLIQVNIESAPLVEAALGEASQQIVVDGDQLLDYFQSEQARIPGRVVFIQLHASRPLGVENIELLAGQPGVIGHALKHIEYLPEYDSVVKRLLYKTWFVESLQKAIELRSASNQELRFISVSGEVLHPDGSFVVGSQCSSTGLISRRSELRALLTQIKELEDKIDVEKQEINNLRQKLHEEEQLLRRLIQQQQQSEKGLSTLRLKIQTALQRNNQFEEQHEILTAALLAAQTDYAASHEQQNKAQQDLSNSKIIFSALDEEISAGNLTIEHVENQQKRHGQKVTSAKVQVATSEQRLEGLKIQQQQYQTAQIERARILLELCSQLTNCLRQHKKTERAILLNTSEISVHYLRKEQFLSETNQLLAHRDKLGSERSVFSEQSLGFRKQSHQLEEAQHTKELAANQIRHERSTLADRLRDDYGIELSELQHEPTAEEKHQREVIDREIADLRRKITNIGAVNMDALAELQELETRYNSLSTQHLDLVKAKQSLEKIIEKINSDSRRLFAETLEAIRINFKALFRKVFGGGHADIVLEEGVDILESGVDIIATPPGKQPLSISLLSGGEKALTAVTLLLAIFQFRPSPFCVLDEVDGPLDEANIGRFLDSIQEFLTWTKFVIVTHSKKTMMAASTLYGVTMQESGISKRVSVRFEDFTENGHIKTQDVTDKKQEQSTLPASNQDEDRGAA